MGRYRDDPGTGRAGPEGDDPANRPLRTPGVHYKYNDVRINLLAYSLLQVVREPLPQVRNYVYIDREHDLMIVLRWMPDLDGVVTRTLAALEEG